MKDSTHMRPLKLFAAVVASLLISVPASAQKIRTEFTARAMVGIYNGSCNLTGGVRLSDNWTVGALAGNGNVYIDAAPGNIKYIKAGAFARGYAHLGKNDIFALYADFTAGGACVYKVNGKYLYGVEGQEPLEMIDDNPGDLAPLMAFEPGIRVRLFKNIHVFLGPTISTLGMGVHAGIGF